MGSQPKSGGSRTIAAVDKCCSILDALHDLQGATLTELADHVGLAPGTVHPHLKTLYNNQLITRKDGVYYPGFKFLRVGATRRRDNVLYKHASGKMDDLAENLDARVGLYVEEFGMATCLDQTGSRTTMQPPDKVGDRVHLHVIAAGKAILAAFPDERVAEIVNRHGLPAYTDKSIVDTDELLADLEEVSEQGYAFNHEEHILGLTAVGAAITTDDGDILGAISAAVPTNRMDDPEFTRKLTNETASVANTIELDIRVDRERTRGDVPPSEPGW